MDLYDIYNTDPFFNGSFDITVEYVPGGGGSSREVQAIFDAKGALITVGDAVIINESDTLTIRTKDVKDLDNRATFKFTPPESDKMLNMRVADYIHDGTGLTIVNLTKDE